MAWPRQYCHIRLRNLLLDLLGERHQRILFDSLRHINDDLTVRHILAHTARGASGKWRRHCQDDEVLLLDRTLHIRRKHHILRDLHSRKLTHMLPPH